MGKHRKWFWISGLYDNKRDILLNGMTLSGTDCNGLLTNVCTQSPFTTQLPTTQRLLATLVQFSVSNPWTAR